VSRPVIGSAYQPHRTEHRTPMTYSSLRQTPDRDAAQLQRALLADASSRARSMRSATSDDMRLAKAHRICFDLLRALRLRVSPDTQREGEDAEVRR